MRRSEIFERLSILEQRRVLSCVVAALAVIREPRHWTQFVFARDAKGRTVDVHHESAICFCVVGVIRKFARDSDEALRVCSCLEEFADDVPLQKLNDGMFGHWTVVMLLSGFIAGYERRVEPART